MTNKTARRTKALIELPACIIQRRDLQEEQNRKINSIFIIIIIIIIILWLHYPRRISASLDALLHTSMSSVTFLQVTKSIFLMSTSFFNWNSKILHSVSRWNIPCHSLRSKCSGCETDRWQSSSDVVQDEWSGESVPHLRHYGACREELNFYIFFFILTLVIPKRLSNSYKVQIQANIIYKTKYS